jgi:hypothetical protein
MPCRPLHLVLLCEPLGWEIKRTGFAHWRITSLERGIQVAVKQEISTGNTQVFLWYLHNLAIFTPVSRSEIGLKEVTVYLNFINKEPLVGMLEETCHWETTDNRKTNLVTVTFNRPRQNSSVVYRWATGWMIEGSSPGRSWEFFSSLPRRDRLWGSPNLLSNEYQGLFPWGQSGWSVKLTTHPHLVPRSRMRGAIPSLS